MATVAGRGAGYDHGLRSAFLEFGLDLELIDDIRPDYTADDLMDSQILKFTWPPWYSTMQDAWSMLLTQKGASRSPTA